MGTPGITDPVPPHLAHATGFSNKATTPDADGASIKRTPNAVKLRLKEGSEVVTDPRAPRLDLESMLCGCI